MMPDPTTPRAFVTRSFVAWSDEKKWSLAICEALIRLGILDLADLDVHFAQIILQGGVTSSPSPALDFLHVLLKKLVVDEPVRPGAMWPIFWRYLAYFLGLFGIRGVGFSCVWAGSCVT